MTLRARLSDSLKEAQKSGDRVAITTLRLILAAIKDRDLAARAKGLHEGVSNDEILEVLHAMVRQRREAIEMYERGGRLELAQQEAAEIAFIERFLPRQLDATETREAVTNVIGELGAEGLKDMGRVMETLRMRYRGQMNFAEASKVAKDMLR